MKSTFKLICSTIPATVAILVAILFPVGTPIDLTNFCTTFGLELIWIGSTVVTYDMIDMTTIEEKPKNKKLLKHIG